MMFSPASSTALCLLVCHIIPVAGTVRARTGGLESVRHKPGHASDILGYLHAHIHGRKSRLNGSTYTLPQI